MFLINVHFRPARSKTNSSKPGVVFYKIIGKPSFGDGPKLERNVNSDISGVDGSVLQTERDRITTQIRLLYCIIENRERKGIVFTADDVTEDFRQALIGADSMADIIAKSKTEFPFKRDLVNVNRWFKGDFNMVYAQREIDNKDSFAEYVSNLSRKLKNEKRDSQSRNFLSLLSNLLTFANDRDVYFSKIDSDFIHGYAEWLKQTGITGSTQSFYLRTFQTILNKAQKDGLIDISSDWFADVNTKIYHSNSSADKEFSRELLLEIRDIDLSADEQLAQARDLFMFGYYCGGMELVDIVNLTADNISGNVLKYRRRLKGKEVTVVLGEQALAILNRYKSDNCRHLFPMLDKSGGTTFTFVRHNVGCGLKAVGKLVGHPNLTFSMNISAYKSLVAGLNISEMILLQGCAK